MAEKRTLIPWLQERIWLLEAAHTPETLAVSVILSLREIISSGTTGLLDMGSVRHSDVTVSILKESGIRAVACNALMDLGPDYIVQPIEWLQKESDKVRKLCGGLVSYGFAPRFVLSCSKELWQWLALEDRSILRTTHAAESPQEMQNSRIAAAGGNIHLLHSMGFTGERTCLAHCVHLQPGEWEILRKTGTAVVHCPWTNLKLGSGIADIPGLIKSGVKVMLGSDGASCNNRLDLNGDLRLAMDLASVKASPAIASGIRWMDIAGSFAAEFLGFSGFESDSVELELSETEEQELALCEDRNRYLMEIPGDGRVTKVTCAGKVIFDHGEFPTLPPLPLSVDKARETVWNRALKLGMKP